MKRAFVWMATCKVGARYEPLDRKGEGFCRVKTKVRRACPFEGKDVTTPILCLIFTLCLNIW